MKGEATRHKTRLFISNKQRINGCDRSGQVFFFFFKHFLFCFISILVGPFIFFTFSLVSSAVGNGHTFFLAAQRYTAGTDTPERVQLVLVYF